MITNQKSHCVDFEVFHVVTLTQLLLEFLAQSRLISDKPPSINGLYLNGLERAICILEVLVKLLVQETCLMRAYEETFIVVISFSLENSLLFHLIGTEEAQLQIVLEAVVVQ